MAALSCGTGTTMFVENMFTSRYGHVGELCRMGANIQVDGKVAVVEGVKQLTGAPVCATDLRAGAAMVVAGLAASGTTEIEQIHYIERGYDNIVEKLSKLGADIQEKKIMEEDWRTSAG